MKAAHEADISNPAPILIVGMSAAGAESLPTQRLKEINSADLLIGGRRHLNYFPHFKRETLLIGNNIQTVVERLQRARNDGEQAVVLASGDPLYYGIGATLQRYFPTEYLKIVPTASAFQLAFAALIEPWHDALLLSVHGRPLAAIIPHLVCRNAETQTGQAPTNALASVVEYGLTAPKAAILTDNHNTPPLIAQALLNAGLKPDTACAICENLGSPEQRIVRTTLAEVKQAAYAALNVFVVWNSTHDKIADSKNKVTTKQMPCPATPTYPPGLADELWSTSAGQLTKREVRLLSLAELALQPHDVMWDIGAGSGSIGIESGRACPTASIYAIEKRATMCDHIYENLRRFPTPNLTLSVGSAPAGLKKWPQPNAVFIGGSGGYLVEIIDRVQQRLHTQGRLVINLVTLENLQLIRQLLPQASITQVQLNRSVPILDMLRFEALNPVFLVTWRKD